MSSYWARKAQSYNSSGKQSRYFSKQTRPSTPATPPPPLGPLLKSLRVNDLDNDPNNQHSATIQDCKANPPLWSPPPNPPPQLREDSGTYHRDRNAARYPQHPLEPTLITCLRTTGNLNPSLISSLDIVACSSTLGNLLRFVRGQDKTFRILVEKVGTTVFFVRRENSPTETIPDVRGYGHAFPEAYTMWEREAKGSSSHQRVITYRFGGLKLLVRFEADGYMRDEVGGADGIGTVKVGEDESDNQDVDGLFSSLKISASSSSSNSDSSAISQVNSKASSAPTLTIKESPNSLVPQSQIFDLKTRSIRARGVKDTLSEELPRLWVSQIPRFILAYHTRGLFQREDMEIKDVREDVKRWEKEQKQALTKLVGLLKWIREVVDEIEGKKMEVVHREDAIGILEIREQGWPAEKLSLDGWKDGSDDEEGKKKKTDIIKGDKVMSDAIRTEWINAQDGPADEKSDIREKKRNTKIYIEEEEEEDVDTQEKGRQYDGNTNDDDDKSNSWDNPMKNNYFFRHDLAREKHATDSDGEEDDPWEFDDTEQDFTACSEKCGYCGRC
ncbi:hypothetical protein NEUTE1DRAFT_146870 [Neurospora tetrasperma FGSC 2508]|uniref:Geranylgeranyl pyrophosphate synthetase n=1 Tax=Neurospora tetrasperma (strain FGSC 2508 / ATCC MYA-4615 / P0657) TaxID=510951 RepID=F8MRI5_NEUT8|nr:uncharacterized protein NEUTE1DRAFT_146870 [Neurospora tetrasperma FGSC 2508]EGO56094.1 hypothetical protein NEUTE1DRAFT_146870 [Neurospora tetrasperma FGSC 2508]